MLDATNCRVEEGLDSDGHAELRSLLVEASESGRVVILRGRLSSYYLKQRAQEIAKLAKGVVRVVNAIEVAPDQVLGSALTTAIPSRRQGGRQTEGC